MIKMQEELIQQFRDGNRQAGDDFYNANKNLVYHTAYKYKPKSMDFEETLAIVNQAFAHSMKNVDLERAMFSTYFSVVAHGMIMRHCRDYEQTIRTQRRDYMKDSSMKVYCGSIDKVIYESETENITIGHIISSQDDFTEIFVNEALSKLKEKDRKAFELQHLKGLSQRQIGKICGCGQVEIGRRIARAKASLKVILKDAC
jgi:RNA polymerase sigma factor (sigma-70 family)